MDIEQHDLDPTLKHALSELRDTPPPTDLWPGVSKRMAPRLPKGTIMIRWPAALAAGLALAVLSAAGTVALLHRAAPGTVTAAGPAPATAVVPAAFTSADAALAQAIADLEAAVKANVQALDPAARASIAKSLSALDQAITDAAAQRRATPDDPRAARYLTTTLRKKLDLLRTVSQLTAVRS